MARDGAVGWNQTASSGRFLIKIMDTRLIDLRLSLGDTTQNFLRRIDI